MGNLLFVAITFALLAWFGFEVSVRRASLLALAASILLGAASIAFALVYLKEIAHV